MTKKSNSLSIFSTALLGATLLGTTAVPTIASADNGNQSNRAVIYFTRHAEKETTQHVLGVATTIFDTDDAPPFGNRGQNYDDMCGLEKCAEELSDLGLLRAQLLADWFDSHGITKHITHVYSSHKERTRQTVEEIAMRAGLTNDDDLIMDGVQQLPADGSELNPQSTGDSEEPTVDAIYQLQGGDVAVIAGHSGTLYDIMDDLGIDTSDGGDFPRDDDGKVRDFGDLWKVVIKNDEAKLRWRKNLQPVRLRTVETEPSTPPMVQLQ